MASVSEKTVWATFSLSSARASGGRQTHAPGIADGGTPLSTTTTPPTTTGSAAKYMKPGKSAIATAIGLGKSVRKGGSNRTNAKWIEGR